MRKFGTIVLMAAFMASTLQAATLAVWDNDNIYTAVRSNAVHAVDVDLSASYLELSPTVALPAEQWENSLNAYVWDGASNLATAVSSGQYFSFTVTPNAGKQVDYSELFARISLSDKDNAGASVQVVLMSSATGFSVGDEIGSFVASVLPGDVSITENTFNLSGEIALMDNPSPVVFRLYYYTTSGTAGRFAIGHTFWVDEEADVSVFGLVEEAVTLPTLPLAMWQFDSLPDKGTNAAVNVVAEGVTAGNFAQSYRWFNDLANWPNSMWALISDLPEVTNLVSSITEDRYHTFTVKPDAGKMLDYKNIAARVTLNSAANAGTSATLVLMSSATGFSDGDEIGSFVAVHNIADGAATDNGLINMDISGVEALQNITEEVEFRLYAFINDGNANRIGFGHIFFTDGADDILVEGTIDDAPVLPTKPATIVAFTSVSANVLKMVVNAPDASELYSPLATMDLVNGGWGAVAHSDDGVNPFVVTNLSYSTVEGTNEVIYVQASDAHKFYGVNHQ